MRLACIGWGSLVWSPRELPCRGRWRLDGPELPIEFSRVSADGRVTLAITRGAPRVSSLWIDLDSRSPSDAVRALADREGIRRPPGGELPDTIGYWSERGAHSGHPEVETVAAFARSVALDGVVWTALEPGLCEATRGSVPDGEDLLDHIGRLGARETERAAEYVRNAPAPIDTPNRRLFRERLGWHPSDLAYSACGLSRARDAVR